MGISGLLPALKSITKKVHVQEYAGKRVAVDTYGWLHRGALTCSKDICEENPTDRLADLAAGPCLHHNEGTSKWSFIYVFVFTPVCRFINYCMHRVNLLRHHGVVPVLVFDGGVLPMKADQELKRARSRKENLARAIEHEQAGNQGAAYECYQKAVDITPAIANELVKVLKKSNVEYVVAPYEADAQMAFLALSGHVDAVITEDSDLIAYGCPRMVLEMCILSGCDYLPSMQGMGIRRAHSLMRRFKNFTKVIRSLRFNGVAIPPGYEDGFRKAMLTFQHQRVYDPARQELVHLHPLDSASQEADDDIDFAALECEESPRDRFLSDLDVRVEDMEFFSATPQPINSMGALGSPPPNPFSLVRDMRHRRSPLGSGTMSHGPSRSPSHSHSHSHSHRRGGLRSLGSSPSLSTHLPAPSGGGRRISSFFSPEDGSGGGNSDGGGVRRGGGGGLAGLNRNN
eukprot:jgi/Mesen1/3000/ME000177S02267